MDKFTCLPTDCVKSLIQSIQSNLNLKDAYAIVDQDIANIKIESLTEMLESNNAVISPILNGKLFEKKRTTISARQKLIENKSVYGVIQLAPSLLEGTNVSLSVIILKENSDVIRFVNASEIFTEIRRNKNTLSDDNISQIISMISEPSDYSVHTEVNQLRDDYDLLPIGYIKESKGNTPLREIALDVMTGMKASAKKSDACVSAKVITASDVKRFSQIDIDDLVEIDVTDVFLKKNRLHGRYLLISRNGAAQVNVNDENVVLSAGVIAVELINPDLYDYVEAYLNSDTGMKQVSDSSGSSIVLPKVDNIYIQIPDTDMMNSIGTAYTSLKSSLRAIEDCKEKIIKSINDLF